MSQLDILLAEIYARLDDDAARLARVATLLITQGQCRGGSANAGYNAFWGR